MTAVLSTLGLDQADLLTTAQESHRTAGRTSLLDTILVWAAGHRQHREQGRESVSSQPRSLKEQYFNN